MRALRERPRIERVAEQLFVSPSTLRYRLGRFEERAGASLRDPDRGVRGLVGARACVDAHLSRFWSELQVRGRLIWCPVPSGAAVGRGHWSSHTD